MLDKLNVELLDPVVSKGTATEEDYQAIDRLADELEEKLK
jgi:hypothetical protein